VRFGVLTLPNEPWDALVDRWRSLDEQGWDAIYVADHLANPFRPAERWSEAWACVQTMALVTERARIGPLVTSIVFRNPATVLCAAQTADEASGGRLVLGVGAGGVPSDHLLAGVERWGRDERAARFEAFTDAVAAGLAGAGRRIPLVLAGLVDTSLRLAVEHADGWCTSVGRGLSPEEGRERSAERVGFLERACVEQGRDPASIERLVLLGHRFVAEEPFRSQEAFAEVAQAWHALGFDELVVYADPRLMAPRGEDPPPRIVERVARDVLPGLRRTLAAHA
jgi:alkanesulfonate monooxygenase SsuD/methylene tetrahydromethanopterin reductase-like flavin-dependent oxidoreductase (luciferase family)